MATWPTTLPQAPLLSGFTEASESVLIRSTVDVGPAKLRPRATRETVTFQMSMVLTTAQVATLETFYKVTVGFGADAFDWVHPRTAAALSCRFRSRPQYNKLALDFYEVTFMIEDVP